LLFYLSYVFRLRLLSEDSYLLDGLQTKQVFSFYLRDAMLARYLLLSCVCLSVCLPQVGCSTKMAKRRIMQTTPCDSPRTCLAIFVKQPTCGSFVTPTAIGWQRPIPLKFALKFTHPLSNTVASTMDTPC